LHPRKFNLTNRGNDSTVRFVLSRGPRYAEAIIAETVVTKTVTAETLVAEAVIAEAIPADGVVAEAFRPITSPSSRLQSVHDANDDSKRDRRVGSA
jgi:hypothetical protein